MTATVIPFPARTIPAGWPTGEQGQQLESLARLLQERGNRQPGSYVTLAKARAAALDAYHDLLEIQARRAQP